MEGEGVLDRLGVKYKGHFKNGQKDGNAVEIKKDGTRIDCTYREGILDGPYVEYDKNGNVKEKGEYKNGKKLNKTGENA